MRTNQWVDKLNKLQELGIPPHPIKDQDPRVKDYKGTYKQFLDELYPDDPADD